MTDHCHSLAEIIPTIHPGEVENINEYQQTLGSESDDYCIMDTPPLAMLQSTSDCPSREEFGGNHDFSIVMDGKINGPKRTWEFSRELNKLFIKMGCFVPIHFQINPNFLTRGLKVRAVLVFDSDDDVNEPVIRCPVHRSPNHKSNHDPKYLHLEHVIACRHRLATYELNRKSGRFSVVVPLERPQPGTSYIPLMFGLMCKSSCEGGINRRSTSIIFTLEDQQHVKGRRVVKVRVCSCPKRDMNQEMGQLNEDCNKQQMRPKKRKMPLEPKQERKQQVEPEYLEYQVSSDNLPPNTEYVEVGNRNHYIKLLKRSLELYKVRYCPLLDTYERLIKEAEGNN